jgi:hypothetical protein
MLPIASDFVVQAVRAKAHSALPHAPVIPDEAPTTARVRRRIKVADGLRRLADRVEPVSRPPNHVGAGS